MTRLKYKGNTFIKEMNDKILIRVTKKEYLFEKNLFNYDLLIRILKFFKNATDVYDFVQKEKSAGDEKTSMSHLYLLMKIGSIKEVEGTFVESAENNYLFRNYDDYVSILLQEKLPVYYLNNAEELSYLGLGIYITTYLEENIVCLIEENRQFLRFLKELSIKARREIVSKNVIGILEHYAALLSWDYFAEKRKFNPYFVLTKRLEIINYEPINLDVSQFVCKEVDNLQLHEPHQVSASIINFFIQHPSFFLNYNIDKNQSEGYTGSYSFNGFNLAEEYVEDESYIKALLRMQYNIFSNHPHLASENLEIKNFEYKQGEILRYHNEIYKKTGVLLVLGGN